MNILFGALLLALLLVPGFIFRMAYLAKPASKSFHSTFLEELPFSLLPAFILQAAGYLVVKLFGTLNERVFLLLLLNSDKATATSLGGRDVGLFTLYLMALCVVAMALGWGLRLLALRTRLHLRYSLFRIYNEWQIYFDGIILDYPDKAGESRNVLYRWLDVVTENKEGAFIYSGILDEYVLGKDDTLQRIYLTAVRRRRLADDSAASAVEPEANSEETSTQSVANGSAQEPEALSRWAARYYFMPGDFFMIPGDQIKSINITYYTAEVSG